MHVHYVFTPTLPLILIGVLLGGCGDSGSGSGASPTGMLTVSITDAPVDSAEKVVIHFTSVTVKSGGGHTEIPVTDPATGQPGRSIDVLALSGGDSVVLFDQVLAAGHYSWMRLDVDFNRAKTYIQIDDKRHALRCTSCEDNGVKLNRSFTIDVAQVTAFTLDFDLRKSITFDNRDYHLRPTVRVVNADTAGNIVGAVTNTVMANYDAPYSCIVYVYEGRDVQPHDIYLPLDGTVPGSHNNPVSTARVEPTITGGGFGYMAAHLPPGDYTLSLTCDGDFDDPAQPDGGVVFYDAGNATVPLGETVIYDFAIP